MTQWIKFCTRKGSSPYRTNISLVLQFLVSLHKEGLSYSSVNAARSALSAFITLEGGCNIGSHPLVSKVMKGLFILKPPTPRYKNIWDVKPVLTYLRTLSPVRTISLKELSLKLCMMLALLGASRTQQLKAFRVDKLEIKGSCIVFTVDELMKTDKQGKATGHRIEFTAYPPDRRLCILKVLREYLRRTEEFRDGQKQLLLSYRKPHGVVSKDKIARWIREVLALAGIDVDIFKAHSVRSAAVSAAGVAFVPVTEIINRAGWSNASTFQKYYNKPVQQQGNFQTAILSSK